MHKFTYLDVMIRAARENDGALLDQLATHLADCEEAKTILRAKGYGDTGMSVAATGMVPMPALHEKALGGHAVLLVGYDDAAQRFLVMNSWGTSWGMQGFFTIPYAYVTSRLASDFWAIKVIQ